jgi:hypothetical protein
MSRWYRAYEGTCTDPKLAEAALVAGCSRSIIIAAWHMVLEDAARTNDGGRFEIPTRRIAAALCEPLDLMEAVFDAFSSIGLLADAHVAAWKRRQYESDNSTERSRAHRKRKRNGDATLQDGSATAPNTETETPLPDGNGRAAPSAVDFQKAIFDSGKAILKAAGHDERQAGSIIGRFRKTYSDSQVLAVLSRCEIERPSEPVEWITKALQHETRANGQRSQFSKPTTRQIGERVAARLSGGSSGPADGLPRLGSSGGYG